jgi:lipopolysaccharide/colanic/teichoic acid biosynthesis glycosyltransferase
MKRVFDLTAAVLGLISLFPFFLVIGFLIKLKDKGPVFFKQVRVGRYGKLFILYKLRTMRNVEYSCSGLFEPGNLTRTNSFGRFLRRTKLDELPQLFNVLNGDMSLVGPRPEVEKWVAFYPERWNNILSVAPGMTDNASIEFRNEELLLSESKEPEKTYLEVILPKKLELNEIYLANKSFLGDLKLIFKTIFLIVNNK